MLKLPKTLLEHPRREAIEAFFSASVAPLFPEARSRVTLRPFDQPLREALKAAFGMRHLIQGLELIETVLDREEKGLALVRQKTGQPESQRLSRLVILAADGTPRFYRDADRLLERHKSRVWGVKVDATGEELGRGATPKGGSAKALMIDDKDALVLALARLVDRS
jgi:hypothetical protein